MSFSAGQPPVWTAAFVVVGLWTFAPGAQLYSALQYQLLHCGGYCECYPVHCRMPAMGYCTDQCLNIAYGTAAVYFSPRSQHAQRNSNNGSLNCSAAHFLCNSSTINTIYTTYTICTIYTIYSICTIYTIHTIYTIYSQLSSTAAQWRPHSSADD